MHHCTIKKQHTNAFLGCVKYITTKIKIKRIHSELTMEKHLECFRSSYFTKHKLRYTQKITSRMIKGLETMSHAAVFGQRKMEPSRQKKLSPTWEELSPSEAELTWVDRKKKHEELFKACSALDLGEEREKEKSLRFLSCVAQFTKTGDQSGI